MSNSDSDDILSADFLEPGELLDSDEDEQPDSNSTSARTNQSILVNRTKVCLLFKLFHTFINALCFTVE